MKCRFNSNTSNLAEKSYFLYGKNKITKFIGTARILSAKQIEVSNNGKLEIINTNKIIIATGSEPSVLPSINVDEKLIVTKDLFQDSLIKLSLGKKRHLKVELI